MRADARWLKSGLRNPWMGIPRVVRRLLVSYLVVSMVYCLGIELYGPFLRSMIVCDMPVTPGDTSSGSVHCGDKAYVLSAAQAQEGSLVSMKLAVHAVAGPLLGVFADRVGRRPMLLTSLAGFTAAFCLFAVISAQRRLHHTLPLMRLCFFVEGATNAFDVVYMSMLADSTPAASDRARAFAAYFACGAAGQVAAQLCAVALLRLHPDSFTTIWSGLSSLLAADVLFVWLAIGETLPAFATTAGSTASTLSRLSPSALLEVVRAPLRLVVAEPFLRLWLLSATVTNLAAGLSGVLASFSIAAYGWRPGDLQAYLSLNSLLRTCSLSFLSPIVNGRFQPSQVVLVQVTASVGASLAQVLAPLSPELLLWPGYLRDSLAFATPANAAFLSSQFGADKQATVNSVLHLSSNLSTSLSFALFSSPSLFKPEATGKNAAAPFALAFLLTACGGAIKARMVAPHLRGVCFKRAEVDPHLYV